MFLAYASPRGHALIERELYLPSPGRKTGPAPLGGDLPEVELTTKPRQAQVMISRAIEASVPFSWFTADEVYGQAKYLQAWLEDQDVFYVMAIRRSDTLATPAGEQRADALIAAAPAGPGSGSGGCRAHGLGVHWARIPVRAGGRPGRGHWLLARRSLPGPTESLFTPATGSRRSSTADLAWAAGSRWHIEECFQQAKGEAGFDHYQVRSWRAWYAHITLSMLALAWLAASRAQAERGIGTSDPGMIGYTLPEIRRLLTSLVQRYSPDPERVGSWSSWRKTPAPSPALPLPATRIRTHLSAVAVL